MEAFVKLLAYSVLEITSLRKGRELVGVIVFFIFLYQDMLQAVVRADLCFLNMQPRIHCIFMF